MDEIVLGIDGGGSSTRARAVDAASERIVFEAAVGGTNPHGRAAVDIADRLRDLLDGCPTPRAVAACISGVRGDAGRARFHAWLGQRFPRATIHLEPDFAAALRCFDPPVSMCVVAGTGSIVCSGRPGREIATTGGNGHLLGDQGSAFRLGQMLLSRYLTDPDAVDGLGPMIDAAVGVDRHSLVAAVHGSPEPAALVARAAPVLTSAAAEEVLWARRLVDDELDLLAAQVERHGAHNHIDGPWSVGLAGGVWTSGYARTSFGSALARRADTEIELVTAAHPMVVGATALARDLL